MFCVFCVRFSARKTHKTCTKTIKRCRQRPCLCLHWHKHLLDPCSTTCYTLHAKASFHHNRLRRCRRRSLLPGSGERCLGDSVKGPPVIHLLCTSCRRQPVRKRKEREKKVLLQCITKEWTKKRKDRLFLYERKMATCFKASPSEKENDK